MAEIHFQFDKDQKTYSIDLKETTPGTTNEVVIDGKYYQMFGDSKQLKYLQEQIPQFSKHQTISFMEFQSRVTSLGGHDISVINKTSVTALSILSPHFKEVEALLQRWKETTTQRLALQKQLKEARESNSKNIEDLEKKVMEAKKTEMDAYLQYMVLAKNFRGTVLIQEKGTPILWKGYGPKNETGAVNTKDTRFCIGSMTKQFTGAAIGLLMQNNLLITNPEIRKKLDLDKGKVLTLNTPIKALLPSKYWSDKWEGITLEDLLRHTSGLLCYGSSQEDELRTKNFTLDDLIAIVKEQDLLFNPGEMHFYSNSGYVLLGAIIENLTGQPLDTFMGQHIFKPCGMDQTGMFSSYDENNVASGFVEVEKGQMLKVPTPIHLSKTYAAGGIISTVEDMGKWDQVLYTNSPFTNETKTKMFTCPTPLKLYNPKDTKLAYTTDAKGKHHPISGKEYPTVYYGFGIGVSCDSKIPSHSMRGDILRHDGALPGFSSFMARYIPSNRCLILLENNGEIPQKEEVQTQLEDILFS